MVNFPSREGGDPTTADIFKEPSEPPFCPLEQALVTEIECVTWVKYEALEKPGRDTFVPEGNNNKQLTVRGHRAQLCNNRPAGRTHVCQDPGSAGCPDTTVCGQAFCHKNKGCPGSSTGPPRSRSLGPWYLSQSHTLRGQHTGNRHSRSTLRRGLEGA